MMDADDWDFIFNYTDALFYRLAVGITSRADMSLADCHEELWTAFESGCFRLRDGDDDSVGEVGVVTCHTNDDRCAAMEENKRLADYRRQVEGRVQKNKMTVQSFCYQRKPPHECAI
jgi:hypothetical protein